MDMTDASVTSQNQQQHVVRGRTNSVSWCSNSSTSNFAEGRAIIYKTQFQYPTKAEREDGDNIKDENQRER